MKYTVTLIILVLGLTLVTSYSYKNGTENESKFRTPLSTDNPVSENYLAWIGYRLNKQRMKSIVKNSTLLLFTCDYEKTYNVTKSDHMELLIKDLVDGDIVQLSSWSRVAWVRRLKIGGTKLGQCRSAVYQYSTPSQTLHGRSKLYKCHSGVDVNEKSCLKNGAYFAAAGILEHFYENSNLSLLLGFTLNYFQNYRYSRSTIVEEIFRPVYPLELSGYSIVSRY